MSRLSRLVALAVLVALALPASAPAQTPPLTLLERAQLAEHRDFQRRVTIAMLTVAVDVLREDPATTAHAQRVRLAGMALKEPQFVVQRLASVIVITPTMSPEIADSTLLTIIRTHWTAFAVGLTS